MVDRIDKIEGVDDYWKIAASNETDKEKSRQGESDGREKDAFAALGEKTDWKLLFDKSKLWNHNIQVDRDETKQVLFRKINLKTDPSLLRVDVELNGGDVISPAFISISRSLGLKMKSLKNGESIPFDLIFQGELLRITIPTNPELFVKQEEGIPAPDKEPEVEVDPNNELTVKSLVLKNTWLSAEMLLAYGTAFIALLLLIIVFVLVGR